MTPEIKIRKANSADTNKIMEAIEDGRAYLAAQGVEQWQNGTGPTVKQVGGDISRGEGYVLTVAGETVGYAAVCVGEDEFYSRIYDGGWIDTYGGYAAIHRVAICGSSRGKKLSKPFFENLISVCETLKIKDVRIDTHPRNFIMQKVIANAGFEYRGMICFPLPFGERKAYQLILK